MKIIINIGNLILLLLAVGTATAQSTGSWGDQGNGRYKNPILESNYPDNDVIRVGDTFYMMSSTDEFSPGMAILKSKDLVNWQFSNYIMPAPITYDKTFDTGQTPSLENAGTWAGSFGYNGEFYFAYWCFNKRQSSVPGSARGKYMIVHAQAKIPATHQVRQKSKFLSFTYQDITVFTP